MNRMNENAEELLIFYALGAVTEDERARVEVYIASNPEAKLRLEEMMQTAAGLPFEAAPVQPSEELKRKLMNRVNADARKRFASMPQTQASSWSRFLDLFRPQAGNWAPHAIAVLSLFIAIGTGLWGLSLRNQYVSLQSEVASLRQELALQREVITRVASADSRAFAISGTEHQPAAHGQLIADPKTGSAVLVVSGLKPLEAGKIYEVWLIKGDTPVAAGLFKVDDQGQAILEVSQNVEPGSYNAVGVSIEPEGGSSQPTGDIVMLGEID